MRLPTQSRPRKPDPRRILTSLLGREEEKLLPLDEVSKFVFAELEKKLQDEMSQKEE